MLVENFKYLFYNFILLNLTYVPQMRHLKLLENNSESQQFIGSNRKTEGWKYYMTDIIKNIKILFNLLPSFLVELLLTPLYSG